jgi:hypothetical protein
MPVSFSTVPEGLSAGDRLPGLHRRPGQRSRRMRVAYGFAQSQVLLRKPTDLRLMQSSGTGKTFPAARCIHEKKGVS